MDRFCVWCGTELNPAYNGLFCCDAHKEKQRLHRRKLDGEPIVTCPKPFKVAYSGRGMALRKAVEYGQRPYLCECGVHHLTSKALHAGRSDDFAAALSNLSEEISPIRVSA